MNPCNLPR